MPPKKAIAALAQSVKGRVSKKKSAPKTTNKKTTASKKATTTASKKNAITADNNPATKKKPALKSAGKAPAPRANTSRKRKSPSTSDEDDDDDEESEGPATKKTKVAEKAAPKKKTARKTAVPKSKAVAKKTAATKTKAAPSKAAPKKTAAKRKAADRDDDDEEEAPAPKKAKTTDTREKATKAAVPKKEVDPILKIKIGVQINFAPTNPLEVFVFGEGSAGELGLGARKLDGRTPIDVKRPRKNPLLSAPTAGIVQIACGGMHGIALTKDNKILTWGVNDQGTLGRNTDWDGGYVAVDGAVDGAEQGSASASEDEDDDSGLNPRESTPTEIDMKYFAPGTKFAQVAASDSASFALTEDGRVYSWGTFRAMDGILGFGQATHIQPYPVLLREPTKVVAIATGSNHVLTLDTKGKIYTWGAAEQNQLGRRVVQRDMKASALRPGGLSFKRGVKIAKIAAGSYHSFALDTQGRVWAWGLNNFCQLGIEADAGEDDATVLQPTLVESLSEYRVADIIGGEHHSLALTDDGKVLVFGRIDGNQSGIPKERLTRGNCRYDEFDKPRMIVVPAVVEIPAVIESADSGTDTSLAVTKEGKVWSWGFNANYQCGVGETVGDVLTPVPVNNSIIRDKRIVWAGCGGQFGMVASIQGEE